MIKIDKDPEEIPASLSSKTTNKRRTEVIKAEKYIAENKYNDRYKHDDIKEKLKEIYHQKCAYCEQSLLDSFPPVEHFRPKALYYWLAYSWDNLLLSCDPCNTAKGDQFEIEGVPAKFDDSESQDIHQLSKKYFDTERPKLVNPEMESVEEKLRFQKNGSVQSDDPRVQYTIDTCNIDREEANAKRKTIYDDHLKNIKAQLLKYKDNKEKREIALSVLKDSFMAKSGDPKTEYLAFRRWMAKSFYGENVC